MHSLPLSANIPLFQFPPSLESDLAPFDDRPPQLNSLPNHSHSSSTLDATTRISGMRHDQPLRFPDEMSSYSLVPHPDHYTHNGAIVNPTSQTLSARSPDGFSPSSLTSSYPAHPHEYVRVDRYPYPNHYMQQQWDLSHSSASSTHHLHGPISVKHEESADEAAAWSQEEMQVPYGVPSESDLYVYEPVEESGPIDEDMIDCKEECTNEGTFLQEPYPIEYLDQMSAPTWNGVTQISLPHASTHPQGLYIDTSAPFTPEYAMSYNTDPMFVDLDTPAHPSNIHRYDHRVTSLHTFRPLPPAPTRSYTLEGAITPISPKPQPSAAPSSLPVTNGSGFSRTLKRKSESPPPMDFLRPPSPPFSQSPCSSGSSSSRSSPSHPPSQLVASGTAPGSPPAALEPPASDNASASTSAGVTASADALMPSQLVQKRPRGRPRKNPPNPRPSSPPPVVDYPFPHFPASHAHARPQAPSPHSGSSAYTLVQASGVSPTVPIASSSMSAAVGCAAGQAMFKLNMAIGVDGADGEGKEPEKKKPIMACLFCRERKIACGPPAPGGPQRCNQCTRRGLVCEYPKESRRGQHKRGARAARVEALASASGAGTSAGTSSASSSSTPASIKPKPKPKVDTSKAQHSQPQPQPGSSSSHAQQPIQAPSSPLTPLPCSPPPLSQAHTLPSHASSPANGGGAMERKSRSDKVAREAGALGKGKERSRSCSRPGGVGGASVKADPWADPQMAARRRAQLQKRRIGVVPPQGGQDSELALAGLQMALGS